MNLLYYIKPLIFMITILSCNLLAMPSKPEIPENNQKVVSTKKSSNTPNLLALKQSKLQMILQQIYDLIAKLSARLENNNDPAGLEKYAQDVEKKEQRGDTETEPETTSTPSDQEDLTQDTPEDIQDEADLEQYNQEVMKDPENEGFPPDEGLSDDDIADLTTQEDETVQNDTSEEEDENYYTDDLMEEDTEQPTTENEW